MVKLNLIDWKIDIYEVYNHYFYVILHVKKIMGSKFTKKAITKIKSKLTQRKII